MGKRSGRKRKPEPRIVCTACEEVMLQSEMLAHGMKPEHRRNVTTMMLDRAIAKVGLKSNCNVAELAFARGY